MALVTLTVGSNARQYATFQAALDAIPIDMVAAGNAYEIVAYNDSEFLGTGPIIDLGSNRIASAECFITIKCAPGHSFRDHASVLTNALRYDQSKGVALSMTAGYTAAIRGTCAYTRIIGLQVKSTTGNSACMDCFNVNGLVDGMLMQGRPQVNNNAYLAIFTAASHVVSNSLLVLMHGGANGLLISSDGLSINNTIVTPSDLGAGNRGITSNASSFNKSIVKNTAVFNFNGGRIAGANILDDGHNATDAATTDAAATSSLVNLVYADQFESITSGAYDFRTKAGSALLNSGTQTAYTSAINGKTRPSGAGFDIGAWELIQGANNIQVSGTSGYSTVPNPITVGADGSITGTVIVTLSDGGAGGSFNPATVSISTASPTGVSNYTRPTNGTSNITVTNNGGLANPAPLALVFASPPVVKTPVPTASSPGRRVVRVGPGMDLANLSALAGYLTTQNLITNNEILIAEVYANQALGGTNWFRVPIEQQDQNHYCIIRPVPGYAQDDVSEDTFDYESDGTEIVVSGDTRTMRGVRFEKFRVKMEGAGTFSMGGPNPNGFPSPSSVVGMARCRINLTGTGGLEMGEYSVHAEFTDNLVIRTAGTSKLGAGNGGDISRNTFVCRNGTAGPIVDTGNGVVTVENNAFVDCGPAPIAGTSSNVVNNYTNTALSTPREGIIVSTSPAMVVDPASDLRPTPTSALIGNGTARANSINDNREANRGIDPDVGAWQRVPATPLPAGAVTGSMTPSGQQLTVNFSTTFNPTSGMATLSPAASNPGEAIGKTGALTFGTNTASAVFTDIAPGNYSLTITISNDGGTSSVTGIQPVSILAVGGAPEAPVSGPVTLSAPGKVTNVSVVAGNGKVSVSGTPPFNTGGSPITGFELVASTGQQISVPSLPADFPLPNNVAVTIRARAVNNQGPGLLSDPSQSVTPVVPPAKPGAPTIGTAVAKNRAVLLTFTPGSAGDSPITGYIVTGSDGQQTSVTGSPALIAAVNNIPKSYKVRAVSAVGAGPDSASSNTVTPQAIVVVTVKTPAGVPLGGLSGLSWAWFDYPLPHLWTAPPTDKGNIEMTAPGTAEMDLILTNSALTSGQVGWLVFTNSDGSPATNHQAFSGPREVN